MTKEQRFSVLDVRYQEECVYQESIESIGPLSEEDTLTLCIALYRGYKTIKV